MIREGPLPGEKSHQLSIDREDGRKIARRSTVKKEARITIVVGPRFVTKAKIKLKEKLVAGAG